MIEPVQGEGGVRTLPVEQLAKLRALADRHGLLLALDEVQTGIGRTGKLFAYEWAGIEPDLMAVAKGIGGGFPLGAVLATAEAAKGLVAGTHGSTFGGNPLAMAVGNAVLDVVLAPGFLDGVRQRGLRLAQALAGLRDTYPDLVLEVRGKGLLTGLKLAPPAQDFVKAAAAERVLVVGAAENVVRLLPPLIVTDAEIGEAVDRLSRALDRMRRSTV
jgi:acetylornithine/N-succinyldiaminopimelate aminotransferase